MSGANDFSKLVPGFDFLQGLLKNAGTGLPTMGQWIAPTLNPEELEKRIDELRTVQFWLEQNARMLAATIQALEVQRMTLSTLKTMNLPMADLRESMKLRVPEPVAAPAPAPAPEAAAPSTEAPAAAPGAVDPMQWWGALTQQFTELAAAALKDGGAGLTKHLPGATAPPKAAVKQSPAAKKPTSAAAKTAKTSAPRKRS